MKIAVCFPCVLVLACIILPSAVNAVFNCGNYVEKPFFNTNTSSLIFFEENEKAIISFCGASNFCSIQWLKNGQLLDPLQNFTDGRLVVKDDGKMLRFSHVLPSDKGNYTCIAINNAGSVRRTQEVDIKSRNKCPSFAENTSESHKALDRITEVGANHSERWEIDTNMNLFCTFGKKDGVNNTPSDCSDCGHCYKDSTRPNIWYAVFNLTDMRAEDFGIYEFSVCDNHGSCACLSKEINLTYNQTATVEVESATVVTISCSMVFVVLFCTLTWHAVKVDVQLFVKDHFYKTEADDGRCYDAYISYTWTDTDRLFVLQLKNHLEKRGYSVYVPEIDNLPGGCTALQLTQALQKSRRFIMVLSPEYVRAYFTAFEVNIFIEAVTHYKDVIIPVVFQGLLAGDESAILRHVLKVGQTVTWANIEWPLSESWEYDDELGIENSNNSKTVMEQSFRMKGYKQLLLKLPPKPKQTVNNFYLLE